MITINALIVDDERLARLELRQVLAEVSTDITECRVVVCGEAASKKEVLAFLAAPENPHPDVIFLDISMQGGSGFEVLEDIDYDSTHPMHIVFVTAYDEYAVRAFRVNALDYVLKPIDPDRIAQTLVRLQKTLHLEANQSQENQAEENQGKEIKAEQNSQEQEHIRCARKRTKTHDGRCYVCNHRQTPPFCAAYGHCLYHGKR
jgi:two-component system, LytTR family, response regulator